MNNAHVLVTGANGPLGSLVAEDLIQAGYSVTGLSRKDVPRAFKGNWRSCDLLDGEQVRNALEGVIFAPVLFVGANITVAGISLVTIVCCFRGNLIPRLVGKPSEIAGGKLDWPLAETLNAVATKDPQTLTVDQQNSADPATRDDHQARLTWNEEAGLLQATTEP